MCPWLTRFHEGTLSSQLVPGKVLILYGARRVGKTSLIQRFLRDRRERHPQERHYVGTGEDLPLRDIFRSSSVAQMRSAFAGYDLIVIDEAQRIPDVGLALKLLVDHVPDARVMASGSSSFRLAAALGEPLTGRHRTLLLYPLSVLELSQQWGGMWVIERLEDLLIFGAYPEVLTAVNRQDRIDLLVALRNSYLFRDILELDHLRNADKLADLLRLIAFQVGHDVSLSEVGGALGLARQTVERYLDLLEKAFVIRRVRGFSRNLRKEVVKSSRYVFLDNGVRNALINNFSPLAARDDIGMLWENFLFAERLKTLAYRRRHADVRFWRTYDRQEIDLVEDRDGQLHAYEFKWSPRRRARPPGAWSKAYPDATHAVVHRDNFLEFLTE